jgi:hypothetical protein
VRVRHTNYYTKEKREDSLVDFLEGEMQDQYYGEEALERVSSETADLRSFLARVLVKLVEKGLLNVEDIAKLTNSEHDELELLP